MRVLVTGDQGYIGSVMVPMLQAAGYDVVGLDVGYFAGCDFESPPSGYPRLTMDVRDVERDDLAGFDAVIHLAALSNDPMCNFDPALTFEINHAAAVRLAELAKEAGVGRFLVSSSCSTYGLAGDSLVTEDAELCPVAPYGESKVMVDRDVARLADDRFSPTFLRNATAYGLSPRLRMDLVINELVAAAVTTGCILVKSDGTPWRPLVHVEDICGAFLAVLDAPREAVHNQAFNVGRSDENYRVRELAEIVCRAVPGSRVEYAPGGGPDKRCYRVDCSKIARMVPAFRPRWDVAKGVAQLAEAYRNGGLDAGDIEGPRFRRLNTLKRHMDRGSVGPDLRWTTKEAAT